MSQDQSLPPSGVYAAVSTPLTDRLQPNLTMFVKHCRWLLDNGCDGLAPLGTTGEANSLSTPQRLALIDAAASAGLPMSRFIIGGGSCALDEAVTVTKAIVAAGSTSALLLPPFYYNPTEAGVYAFFSEVIQRVGSERLRLYLYHFPALSGVPIKVSLIKRLKAAYGPVIAGLKDSSGDWANTAEYLKEVPDFGVFSGSEEFLLANLRAGGVGCISASTNVTSALAHRLFVNWKGPEAEALQAQVTEARKIIQSYPIQAAVKDVLALMTGDRSWRAMIPPNQTLSAAQAAELEAKLLALPQMQPHLPSRKVA